MKKMLLGALIASTVMVAGCHTHRDEGPAEHAGRHIDNAAADVRDSAKGVAENARSAARDVKEDTKESARDIKRNFQD